MRVVHTSGYKYDEPATQSFNEARLTPRVGRGQAVVASRIDISPAVRTHRYTDYWGTAVTTFDLHAPHKELQVVANSLVATAPEYELQTVVDWKDLRAEEVLDKYTEFLAPTKYTPTNKDLTAIAKGLRKKRDPYEASLAVGEFVHEHLAYQQGTTSVHSSAVDAWQAREGVCQDFAHLEIVLLRAIGIPARYVSGYLHTKPDAKLGQVVAGESHAWVESWTGSWNAYDPTNAIGVGPRHVWVATGRDYADVAPLKGIYTGSGHSALDVAVHITRLG
jgi:transglutaminase-like putative cysteine protease